MAEEVVVNVDGGAAPAADASPAAGSESPAPQIPDAKSSVTTTTFVEPEVLIANAKRHMEETAVRDKDGNMYPITTVPKDLGKLGVGVQLYFDFMFQMGIVFVVLQVVTLPNLVSFSMGNMVQDSNPLYKYTGMFTLANFGNCPSGGCLSQEQAWDRCAYDDRRLQEGETCTKASEVAPILGMLDAAAVLIILVFTQVWFRLRYIPKTVTETDDAHITPADYTIFLNQCPRHLGANVTTELHHNYEQEVKKHFTEVLKTMKKNPVDDPDAVAEVSVVHEYQGKITDFMERGETMTERDGCLVAEEIARSRDHVKQAEKHHKNYLKLDEKLKKIDEDLDEQSKVEDREREVVGVFVTFKKEAYKELMLNEYRYAQYTIFRLCQPSRLRLHGKRVQAVQAREPNDIFWENLDYDPVKRRVRKIGVCFMTLVVLLVCSLLIVSMKSIGQPPLPTQPQSAVWLIQPEDPSLGTAAAALSEAKCFKICQHQFFTSSTCDQSVSFSAAWEAKRFFAPSANGTLDSTELGITFDEHFGTDCQQPVLSPACSGETDPKKNWIGFEFVDKKAIGCTKVWQGMLDLTATPASGAGSSNEGIVPQLRYYACAESPNEDDAGNFGPAYCSAMKVANAAATPGIDGIAPSGPLQQATDSSVTCDTEVDAAGRIANTTALLAYEGAKADPDADPEEAWRDATYSCFCLQYEAVYTSQKWYDPNFQAAEKTICQPWIENQVRENLLKYGKLVGTIIAVLVLNQVLLLLYAIFIQWERLTTVSEVTKSQLVKLFAAQFINTGLLAILVNAKIESVPDILSFIKILSIGEGNYYDMTALWFTAVGSSVLITIFMQVFSTTIPPLVMSKTVTPILIWFMSRGKVTQEAMNKAYKLPAWNLSLRLAQTMNVIFCVVMYSGGMPIMYTVGAIYCFVAYWLDKITLLRASARPPAYSDEVLVICMHIMPLAVFLHTCLSAWSFGNQMLFPSDWETFGSPLLVNVAEGLFNITAERSEEVIEVYRLAGSAEQKELYWDFIAARMLDMSRSGSAVLMIVFLVFCTFYLITCVYTLGLKPVVDPLLFLMQETYTCCKVFKPRSEALGLATKDFNEALADAQKGETFSYKMGANEKYQEASRAIQEASENAARNSAEGDKAALKAAQEEDALQMSDGAEKMASALGDMFGLAAPDADQKDKAAEAEKPAEAPQDKIEV